MSKKIDCERTEINKNEIKFSRISEGGRLQYIYNSINGFKS